MRIPSRLAIVSLAAAMIAAMLFITTTTAIAQGVVNTWTGSGNWQVWSPWKDLDNPTKLIQVQERCINEFIYVRFRDEDSRDDKLVLEYGFRAAADRPVPPIHELTLVPGQETSAILADGRTCDLDKREYRIFFFQI